MRLCRLFAAGLTLSALPLFSATMYNNLASADMFAVLAGSTITNTGSTTIYGDIGVSPGTAITGFPPGTLTGTSYSAGAVPLQAQTDLTASYVDAAAQSCSNDYTGTELGGLTLTPGVYCFDSSAGLNGTLTLNAQGDPNALFLFQIGSTLITGSGSTVAFINGGQGGSVYWQVTESATLGTNTTFNGNILALTSITLNTGATIGCGRALARNGAVTLDTNTVSIESAGCLSTTSAAVPEPSTGSLLLFTGFPMIWWGVRRMKQARQ